MALLDWEEPCAKELVEEWQVLLNRLVDAHPVNHSVPRFLMAMGNSIRWEYLCDAGEVKRP
jgi:hypothetical protein